MTQRVIGADIGGTKIAAGIVEAGDGDPVVSEVGVSPTLAGEPLSKSLGQLFGLIERLNSPAVSAIGICAPGPLNPKTGMVINPPNLPHWRNVPLAQIVEDRYGKPCRVENDANAAGLAEVLFGAAVGMESVVYVTLSTGVGAGIILNGRIYHGKNGAAAEGGHVTIDWRSPTICNCGTPGCIEALASGTAMAARAASVDAAVNSAEELGKAVSRNDPVAMRIFDETCDMLAAWMGSVVSLLDPDMIVIGGGVSQIGEPLFSRLRERTPRRTINQFAGDTPIVPAKLAKNVGILGAAAVMMERGVRS